MSQYDFEESIGYWLTLCSQSYHRALAAHLKPFGVTIRACQVLSWIKLSGPLSQGELARKMMIEPPTLVRILERMERSKWITREGDPDDRRRRIVQLTPAAEPLWEHVMVAARQVRQAAVTGLNDDEADQAKQWLRRLFANLNAEESRVTGREIRMPAD